MGITPKLKNWMEKSVLQTYILYYLIRFIQMLVSIAVCAHEDNVNKARWKNKQAFYWLKDKFKVKLITSAEYWLLKCIDLHRDTSCDMHI